MFNTYFRVTGPKRVWVKTGNTPGNSYYGASRIYDVQGKELDLSDGDELHNLCGGLFAVTEDGVYEVLHKSPAEMNNHFCKDYTPRSWYYTKIISTNTTEIPQSQADIPTSYVR